MALLERRGAWDAYLDPTSGHEDRQPQYDHGRCQYLPRANPSHHSTVPDTRPVHSQFEFFLPVVQKGDSLASYPRC